MVEHDEKRVIATEPADEGAEKAKSNITATKKKRTVTAVGVIAAVVVVAALGFWGWHNTPGFCGTMCHTSMNSFVQTYSQKANDAGVDKWGNKVSNTSSMLAVTHAAENTGCLGCHEPVLSQQISELQETVSGNYMLPLEERSLKELMVNSSHATDNGDEFCLKSGCHVNSDKCRRYVPHPSGTQ